MEVAKLSRQIIALQAELVLIEARRKEIRDQLPWLKLLRAVLLT